MFNGNDKMKFVVKGEFGWEKTVWHFINSGKCSASFNMALMKHFWNGIVEEKLVQCFDFMNGSRRHCRLVIFKVSKKKSIWMKLKNMDLVSLDVRLGAEVFSMNTNLHIALLSVKSYPNMPETVTEAYRVISGGVLEGFRNLGLDAHFSVPETRATESTI